jgi:DNA polymerase-3 subunit alpha
MAVAGAFDCFPETAREQYFSLDQKGSSFIESIIRFGNNMKIVRGSNQQTLFGEGGGFNIIKPEPNTCPAWPKLEKLNREKEVIGIYLSSHPLDDFRLEISTFATTTLSEIQNLKEMTDKDIVVAGMVTETRNGIGKNGKPYGTFTLQDYTDSFRFMMFDKDFVENSKYFTTGYYLLVKGRIQKRWQNQNELEVKIKSINLLSSVKDELIKSVTIRVNAEEVTSEMIHELSGLINENKGSTELKFLFYDLGEKVSLPMFSRSIRVRLNNDLISYLEDHPSIDFKVN